MGDSVSSNSFLTQKELAKRWRLSQSCVKNYREAGYLPYFQLPGSKRVLYPVAEIERLEREHLKIVRKEVEPKPKKTETERKSPEGSSACTESKWRI